MQRSNEEAGTSNSTAWQTLRAAHLLLGRRIGALFIFLHSKLTEAWGIRPTTKYLEKTDLRTTVDQ